MPSLADVNPDALLTMLKGEPGTRKSTCAVSYPLPQYWISNDKKMNAILLPAKKWGIDLKQVEFDDYNNWDQIRIKLEALETNCKFKTLIVDSITTGGDNINRQVIKTKGKDAYFIGGIPVDTIEDYKAEASAFRELMALLNSIRKFHKIQVVIIAHVVGQRASNDANKLTHHARVIVTGGDKISAKISAYCDEAYHFNIKPGATESSAGDYSLLTTHTGNDYARTCLPLAREIIFNDKPLFRDWIAPAIKTFKSNPPSEPTSIRA